MDDVGPEVRRFKKGDAVIVHPLVTYGSCSACRRGNDMHCENGMFPGITRDGGFTQYLQVKERNLVRLPENVAPKEIAPHADAGLTAYHAANKAAKVLQPGDSAVIIGFGGLGHIAYQVLRAKCAARSIVVDHSDLALSLAEELGAKHLVRGRDNGVREVLRLTRDKGAEAVLDFVGEGWSIEQGLAMTRNAGSYYLIGYGGTIQMDGTEVFRRAVRVMVDSAERAMAAAGLTADDIDLFVPHQANTRIITSACAKLGIAEDRTVNILATTGNTSAASIPLALADAAADGRLAAGDRVLLIGFGAGMSWASAVIEWAV